MNVMWYVGKFDEATWNLFSMLGMSAAWLREHGRGMAAIDQRIAYQRELHAGDTVFVRSGLLELGAKVVRFCHEMVNAERGQVSAVTQLVGVHMDTTARRAVTWPQEWVVRARERLVQHALPWEARASSGQSAPTLAG
jgi:acyl-CoA thioester hydrolase